MRAFILATLLLAACAAAPAQAPSHPTRPHSPLAQQIVADLARLDAALAAPDIVAVGIGETATLGGGLTVRPLSVAQDSRCPMNVQCVWAGELRVRAVVSGVGETTLKLGEPLTTPHGVVLLAIARPSPWSDWPSAELGPRPDYRFGFRRN